MILGLGVWIPGDCHWPDWPRTGSAWAAGTSRPLAAPTAQDLIIIRQAQENHLPTSLVRAVIKTESNFDPRAVSPKGALGLMQLLPEVCREFQLGDPFDVGQNVRAGTAYLRRMLDRFNNLTLALAAYNCGPEEVERVGGVPPVEETRRYLQVVYCYYNFYRRELDRRAPLIIPPWPPKSGPAPLPWPYLGCGLAADPGLSRRGPRK